MSGGCDGPRSWERDDDKAPSPVADFIKQVPTGRLKAELARREQIDEERKAIDLHNAPLMEEITKLQAEMHRIKGLLK